ncbi:hypothetical protein Acid345_0502 [Candidatus Koribacter versatilis Ellin345]|uniref:Uncharacterized protein n=1 Tax=Koribacter versatilis (strain Ellin345) TaxID=204669 RepID=Q1IUE3_KORVE|nr:hypothetical protein Acid345_0502 [Candidatus Koribacter versatilis Ellin345]
MPGNFRSGEAHFASIGWVNNGRSDLKRTADFEIRLVELSSAPLFFSWSGSQIYEWTRRNIRLFAHWDQIDKNGSLHPKQWGFPYIRESYWHENWLTTGKTKAPFYVGTDDALGNGNPSKTDFQPSSLVNLHRLTRQTKLIDSLSSGSHDARTLVEALIVSVPPQAEGNNGVDRNNSNRPQLKSNFAILSFLLITGFGFYGFYRFGWYLERVGENWRVVIGFYLSLGGFCYGVCMILHFISNHF